MTYDPREAWLERRRAGIGGSDIPAILGFGYGGRGPRAVYEEKTGAGAGAPLPSPATADALYWGRALERVIADRFRADHPELILHRTRYEDEDESPADVRVGPEPWMLATFDGLVHQNDGSGFVSVHQRPIAGWEAKTAREARLAEWRAGVPPDAYVQVQWYLLVSGLSRWYVSALVGGYAYLEHIVERDELIIGSITERARHMWSSIERRIPPEDPLPCEVRAVVAAIRRASRSHVRRARPCSESCVEAHELVDDGDLPYPALFHDACPVCGMTSDGLCEACREELRSSD